MDALLLAGGYGTRLRPLTYTRPKPLLPVAGRPMVAWVLDRLPKEVDRVVVAVNWLADDLEAYFDGLGDGRQYVVVREDEPLGTAGAVKNCAKFLKSPEFYVLNGDIVSDMDLAALLALHRDVGAIGTISLKEVEAAEVVHYGVARLSDTDARRIEAFVEKPASVAAAPSRLINAGAYVLDQRVLDLIDAGRLVSMEKEIFPLLLERGLYGQPFDGFWIDVGDPQRLIAASRQVDPEYRFGPGAQLAPGAVVSRSLAGRDVRVGSGALIEDSVLGDSVQVAAGARIQRCVIGDGEHVMGNHADQRIWTREPPLGYPSKQVGNALA